MSKKDIKTVTTTGRVQMMLSEESAPKGSYGAKKSNLITRDEIIGYSHAGWPLYHLRVISLLRALRVKEDIIQQIPEETLKMQITSVEDDGKGLGINPHKLTECWVNRNKGEVYVFRL